MSDRDVFDFLGLPAELRVIIYEYAFCDTNYSPITLLSRKVPDRSLQTTCNFIDQESANSYQPRVAAFRMKQKVMLSVKLRDEVFLLERDPDKLDPRTWGLEGAIIRLSRLARAGQLPPTFYRCRHTCPKFDSYECNCLEHDRCFNCGRTLALAVYYDLHVEARRPQLVRSDLSLTHLGQLVETHTKQLEHRYCNVANKVVERYPVCEDHLLFGETWWRFELERQIMARKSERTFQLQSEGRAVPSGMLYKLTWWDKVLVRNGLEATDWLQEANQGAVPSSIPSMNDVVSTAMVVGVTAVLLWLWERPLL